MYVPKKIFLTSGVGVHDDKLTSFELALRDAGISPFNLVKVSSIFPPHAELVKREDGLKELKHGQIVHCVMSELATHEPHRLITASIGLSVPKDPSLHGYLAEYNGFGVTEEEAEERAKEMANHMLETLFEENDISSHIYLSQSIAKSAYGDNNRKWTTVIAAAILIP